jgi:Cytochrome C oxidase, cbb3-type, subunit III
VPLALTGYEWGLLLTAIVFIIFALVVAIVIPRTRPTFPSRYLGWFIAACIVLFVGQMTAVLLLAELGGAEHAAEAPNGTEPEPEPTEPEPTEPQPTEPEPTEPEPTEPEPTEPPPGGGGGDPAAGREIFIANCGSCHTFADAGTTGSIGPNLDEAAPSSELAVDRVTNGQGLMPAFGDSLTEQQIQDVAAYVSTPG